MISLKFVICKTYPGTITGYVFLFLTNVHCNHRRLGRLCPKPVCTGSSKKKEQAITKLHAAASAKFLSNLADSTATDGLLSVLDQWQAAKEKRKQAEQAAESSLNTLASSQQRLDAGKQKTMPVSLYFRFCMW